jgi:hypothetical protein
MLKMAEGNITVVDQKPIDKLPYDPNDIPDAVKKRAAAVDALYANGNGSNDSDGSTPRQSSEAPESPVPPETPPPQTSEPAPTPPPASAEPSIEPSAEPSDEGDWKLRYERMHGRYNASQKTIGEMQEQMTQLGNELLHLQRMPPQSRQQSSSPPPPPDAPSYLTQQDVQNYGSELIDVTQRAALHAIAPHLMSLEQQNAELQARLAQEARRNLDQQVEMAVPNYREIDRDPRWHRWLLGIDVLSGRVRQQLLNEAISSAAAPRVISFFRGFQNEEAATGHSEPAPTSHQPAAPREAAIPLSSLAAPGRARPATGGDASLPPDRPIYTRAQIAQLYSLHRKQAYVGREAEWARQEADIIAAGREGRIRS